MRRLVVVKAFCFPFMALFIFCLGVLSVHLGLLFALWVNPLGSVHVGVR
jgi:hypothetical protein